MLSPIRPLQSTEVRRVDEVTPRKYVDARVPSPLAETNEGVRLTIGDDARRLAYGQSSSAQQAAPGSEAPPSVAAFASPPQTGEGSVDAADVQSVFQGATLPLAFQSEDADDAFGAPSNEPNAFANRALRAFTSGGSAPRDAALRDSAPRDSAFPEDDNERLWTTEDSSRVPFEVFQRAVTDATAGATAGTPNRAAAFSPLQPIFSPPENGGEPFGRAVPFEDEEASGSPFGAASTQPESGVMPQLSKEAVDELIADLSWSLPERYSLRPTGTAAA